MAYGQRNKQPSNKTWTNPLNLNYRFSDNGLGYREAADPVIQLFKGVYYLYASKSGGYWYSDNLINWTYRPSTLLPVKDYAPAVMAIQDTVFFIASGGTHRIYYSLHPKQDNWQVYQKSFPLSVTDPDLFLDDDGKVYFYYGCSDVDPIMGVQLDRNRRLDTIGHPQVLIPHNIRDHGWERPGENHIDEKAGWNEGAWMTKRNGKYYLQYAAPGTQFNVYGDGVYISDRPLGPFTYMDNSPFSYKPGGFITGAGHSATFQDRFCNYWHIATMRISVRHMFERRLGLFPAFFDANGNLYCNTSFGDYPQNAVTGKMDFEKESIFTGWMLLSYKKKVQASSSLAGHQPELAVNEDVRNWWSAASGKKGEWFLMDLGHIAAVHAVQINFADQDAKLSDTDKVLPYKYIMEGSKDGKHWEMLIDKSKNNADQVHDYTQLTAAKSLRYLKITCVSVPAGKFSISGFRVFGKGPGPMPSAVTKVEIKREKSDSRTARLSWPTSASATGYVVHYGVAPGKLYNSVMLYDQQSLKLNGLNNGVPYYFRIDAFNEAGVQKGKEKQSF
ncbi:family 43 glycosylhydrolase [Arachidicoccus ginsenosidivorans]